MALIFKHTKGHLGQYEDWWYLERKDDGTAVVRHVWDHVAVNGFAKSEGEKTYTVDEFLSGNHHGTAKQKVKDALGIVE
ncbi:hypothetical protein [Brucella ciceri]|uniref:Phage protein n=1 Tax=Brucella ciceri TaxID=391287 RepID=A0ABX1DZH2_9HYPH|nr:hypothetical protein [Brucella ciceri]